MIVRQLSASGFAATNILVVDDGSRDGTGREAAAAGATVIRHEQNRGKGVALRRGFQYALESDWRVVFTLDADGQHAIEDMRALATAAPRYDVVIGSRFHALGGMPWERRIVNRVTSVVASVLCGKRVEDVQSGFRCIRTAILPAVRTSADRFAAEPEFVCAAVRAGFSVGSVPIQTVYRDERSSIMPIPDTLRFIAMVLRLLWV